MYLSMYILCMLCNFIMYQSVKHFKSVKRHLKVKKFESLFRNVCVCDLMYFKFNVYFVFWMLIKVVIFLLQQQGKFCTYELESIEALEVIFSRKSRQVIGAVIDWQIVISWCLDFQ
eukprot:TRINITY_DN14100_c0_g1_i2.p4 TRINITY_DN14100_c0_g1~~TRINITY_DN14100_c0_g1_i2.p4  ORF type:complete len:116 (-),score=1.64 TRINITY_DN14100_c0_g1_i2:306-653(-)